jgi:hypothetical protein
VKTRRDIGSDGGWHMKAKDENIRSDQLFYCFVDFGKTTDVRDRLSFTECASCRSAFHGASKMARKARRERSTA